ELRRKRVVRPHGSRPSADRETHKKNYSAKLRSHRLQPPAALESRWTPFARGGSIIPAKDMERPPMLLAVPLIEAVTRRYFASDVNRHVLAFPVLHQLLLAKTPVHELLDEFIAAKVEKLHVRFHPTVERHGDPPRPRKNLRIFDGHFVPNDVSRHRR